MKVLCIGGSNDGTRVNISPNRYHFSMPDRSVEVGVEDYRVERLRSGNDQFHIAVLEGLSMSQALTLLLERYPDPWEQPPSASE
jgi:hypothetical protein